MAFDISTMRRPSRIGARVPLSVGPFGGGDGGITVSICFILRLRKLKLSSDGSTEAGDLSDSVKRLSLRRPCSPYRLSSSCARRFCAISSHLSMMTCTASSENPASPSSANASSSSSPNPGSVSLVTAWNKCRAFVNGERGEDAEEGEHGAGVECVLLSKAFLRPTQTDAADFRHAKSETSQSESLLPSSPTRTMLSSAAAHWDLPHFSLRTLHARRSSFYPFLLAAGFVRVFFLQALQVVQVVHFTSEWSFLRPLLVQKLCFLYEEKERIKFL